MSGVLMWGTWFPGVVLIGNGTGQTLVVAVAVAVALVAAVVGPTRCARL